jgi:hypothetical protein
MDNVISRNSEVYKKLISKIKKMESEVDAMKEGNLSCSGKWLNGDQVTQRLGVSKRTLQNYRDKGILPFSTVGGKFYYSVRDIEDLMMRNYVQSKM